MEFLEDLFDFGDRKRGRGKGGDHDDHDRDHDRKSGKGDLTCSKCSKPVLQGAKFCPSCGAEITAQAFCAKCGVKLTQGSAFCHECGTRTK